MSANTSQVGGQHYSAGIQHWDYVLQCLEGRYLEGNISKYVLRHRKKNGTQDLYKALHYMEKLREVNALGKVKPLTYNLEYTRGFPFAEFVDQNGSTHIEALILHLLTCWQGSYDLHEIEQLIKECIKVSEARDRHAQACKAGAGRAVPSSDEGCEPGPGYINQG